MEEVAAGAETGAAEAESVVEEEEAGLAVGTEEAEGPNSGDLGSSDSSEEAEA